MRQRHLQLLITFSTTAAAMAMEKQAMEGQIPGRLIPLPSEISAGCGLAWKTEIPERDRILDFMKARKLKWEMIYEMNLF